VGATAIEKVMARTSGRSSVRPGEVVVCRPDMVVQLDLTISTDGGWYRPLRLFDPDRIAVIFDHSVPAPTVRDAEGMARGRAFAREFGLRHFYDVGEHGISHQIVAERGLAVPGELLVCPDSHTCAVGALNCAGRGVGPIDTLQAMTKGLVWYQVAPTIRYMLTGALREGVYGKDVLFHIAQTFGQHANHSLEFGGAGLATLPLAERWVISTMSAELGAEFVLFDPDSVLMDEYAGRTVRPAIPVTPDADADYADVRTIDLSALEPYVIRPDAVPKNGVPIGELGETIAVQQAFIGSCANGKLEDLRIAARILRGRRVAPGVRLIVTPASQRIYAGALREGIIDALIEAGAVVTNATCGACFGHHMGVLAPGETCITASTRNFKGRMGAPSARIYMGSPATVAASAVTGVITDPRGFLA
jgi:3-isopropylmalate/(R)-2-methylmalate dehydratase large subunit